jgi:hypothetical protein
MDAKLEAAHRELTSRVMGRPGVAGTAIGESGGKPCLKVYVSDEEARKALPKSIGGFRVVLEMTGPFNSW